MALRYLIASAADLDWLVDKDSRASQAWTVRCLALKEYFVAVEGEARVGYLRFSRFWGRIPYLEMIYVDPAWRGVGVGRTLVSTWEEIMCAEGAELVMTSATEDEPEPQAWHRANGYEQSGSMTFGAVQETPELFFIKAI